MQDSNKKLWFSAKRYGYGWTPATWQGWMVLLVYVGILFIDFLNIDSLSHSGSDTLINFAFHFIIATIILLAICYLKGERPRWRWGDDDVSKNTK